MRPVFPAVVLIAAATALAAGVRPARSQGGCGPAPAVEINHVPVAVADPSPELDLLDRLGARPCGAPIRVADLGLARVVPLRDSALYLLGEHAQSVPGRRIVGTTVLVESLAAARRLLGDRSADEVSVAGEPGLLLRTLGMWLELRQAPDPAAR